MRDEPFVIRREIGLERSNNRRQHAANALGHGFLGTNEYRRNRNIKSADGRIRRGEHLTSNIAASAAFLILPSSFNLLPPLHFLLLN
jgi:hypothetical protein